MKLFINKKGLTLVELLIVMAIITILVSISIVGYNHIVDRAKDKGTIAKLTDIQIMGAVLKLDRDSLVAITNLPGLRDPRIQSIVEDINKIHYPNKMIIYGDENHFCAQIELLDGRTWCVDSRRFNDAVDLITCSPVAFACKKIVVVEVPARIHIIPNKGVFGDVFVEHHKDINFSIKNKGDKLLVGSISDFDLNSPFSCYSGCNYSIPAGHTHIGTIRFSPTTEGSNADTIIFRGGGDSNITLTGYGTEGFKAIGYAWSGNIGWISLSSRNCDTDGDGIFEGAGEGVQPVPVNCPTTGTAHSYGVNIDTATGNIFGYAWSENIGWIYFNSTSTPPQAPTYSARLDLATDKVSGWARICNVFQTGCSGALDPNRSGDGWISMRGVTTAPTSTPYGVYFNRYVKEFNGSAWSFPDIGWIQFDH